MIRGMSEGGGHVLVCGLHDLGLRIIEQLHLAGVPVVVLDDHPDPRLVRVVDGWGVPRMTGSPRLSETLVEAGLHTAVAVVCVEEEDLASLETALLVHELRPDVRLVVKLANAAVNRAVGQVIGHDRVLDVAALTAPSMVQACLRSRVQELDLDGARFILVAVGADREGSLRARWDDLVPLAVVDPETARVTVCPPRDSVVHPGDVVHLLGTPDQFTRRGVPVPRPEQPGRRGSPRRTVRRLFSALVREADRPLRVAVAALVVFVVANTVVLHAAYRTANGHRMTLLDAVYFSVETVTTIGYGDFNFATQVTWLRIVSIFMMIGGAVLLASFVALLTNLLVSRRLEESFGRSRVGSLSGHTVVVGLGSVGLRVVESLLAAGQDVVVLERDEGNRYLAQVRALDVPVVVGDGTQRRTLEAVEVRTAAAVAVLTSDDLANIDIGLSVRDTLGQRWSSVPVVLRLFDRQLARTVERDFGFRNVRSTAALAAPWFVGAALGLDILGTFSVEQQPFLVGRLRVQPDGGLAGLRMDQLSASIRVLALRRAGGALEHPVSRDSRFAAEDVAYLAGPYEQLLAVLRRDAVHG
jgi:Trk K+ transport system NAD-binding subunit